MANEITVSATLQINTGSLQRTKQVAGLRVSAATKKVASGVMAVGISEEAIPMGDVSDAGYGFFRNLDATNIIKIRPATALADMIELHPGEFALLPLAPAAPYAIALVAACDLEYEIYSR